MIFGEYARTYARAFQTLDRDIWNYEDGCVLIGLNDLYDATEDPFFFGIIQNFIDRYVREDGTIHKYWAEEYNLDFIPSGRVLFPLYAKTGQEKYRLAIETLMNQLRSQPRTKAGSFWHKGIYPFQVWLDGLYMGLPFYTMYENAFGDGQHYDDIVMQFTNARAVLFDQKEKLYYHAWNETKDIFWADKQTGLSANFWSRSIGWYLMALADVYELLPESQQARKKTLADLWVEALDGMLARQDRESGLFYQLTALPEEPGNYLETTGSLMTACSLMKGVRLGVLKDAKYHAAAEEIMIGIETRMFSQEGRRLSLGGMCKGAGLGPDGNFKRDGSVAYYLSESIVADEQKGAGVSMMAYAQWLRLWSAERQAPDVFSVAIYDRLYDPIMPDEIARQARMEAKQNETNT